MIKWLKADFKKRVCNERGSFIFSAIGWGAAAAITYASISAYSGGQQEKKAKGEAEQAARVQEEKLKELSKPTLTPTPGDAGEQAREAEQKKRRLRSLAGGKTLLSSEPPTLGGGGKTLLGG